MGSRRGRRRLLWDRNPHCHWCKRLTVLPEDARASLPRRGNGGLKPGQRFPPNMATLDHLDTKLDPPRQNAPFEERTVLACYECNHRRGLERVAKEPVESEWARCRRYPFWMQAVGHA